MQGIRQLTKLWKIDTPPPIKDSTNYIANAVTMADRIIFYHIFLFSPTILTLEESIRARNITTFPTFTTEQLRNYPPHSKATAMGHMHAIRGNKKIIPVKLLLAANINETPTPSQEIQPHLIDKQ